MPAANSLISAAWRRRRRWCPTLQPNKPARWPQRTYLSKSLVLGILLQCTVRANRVSLAVPTLGQERSYGPALLNQGFLSADAECSACPTVAKRAAHGSVTYV